MKAPSPEPTGCPELAEEALYGLPGEIVKIILPHSEAHLVALLINVLVAFGNALGRSAYLRVGADFHYCNLFALLVGRASKARKGASLGFVLDLFRAADRFWYEEYILTGLSSGEGLIYQVRDPVVTEKDGEQHVIDPGVEDKRRLVVEGGFAGPLKASPRDDSILSPVLRQGWDGGRLATLTKNSPLRASDPHISLLGHITIEKLLRRLTEVEAANGFLNRFLMVLVERSKPLPFGGEWASVVALLVARLREALEFGRTVGELTGHPPMGLAEFLRRFPESYMHLMRTYSRGTTRISEPPVAELLRKPLPRTPVNTSRGRQATLRQRLDAVAGPDHTAREHVGPQPAPVHEAAQDPGPR